MKTNEVQVNPATLVLLRRLIGKIEDPKSGKPISQKELAERSNVSPSLIAMMETGERQPSFTNICKVATGLGHGVTPQALGNISPEITSLLRDGAA